MSICDLLSLGYSTKVGMPILNSMENYRGYPSAFGSQLNQLSRVRSQFADLSGRTASPRVDKITMQLPGENCVYTGGMKGHRINQNVYVAYTEDSTAADPIVRVSGEADSGYFEFTCHISDINPRNASYAEMSALYGHLVKSGEYSGTGGTVTPYGYEFFGSCDMLKKQDFIAGISLLSVSDQIAPRGRADAKYMLSVYQRFAR